MKNIVIVSILLLFYGVLISSSESMRVTSTSSTSSPVTVTNLRVEHLSNPIGISTLQPRFSWKISYPLYDTLYRSTTQVGYQLLVSSSLTNIQQSVGDIWDSQLINSSSMILIPYPIVDSSSSSLNREYGGNHIYASTTTTTATPLLPGQVYYWSVRVWYITNSSLSPTVTDYSSTVNTLSIGLLNRNDWNNQATFIGVPTTQPGGTPYDAPWCRSTFTLSSTVYSYLSTMNATAYLHVASVGYHEAFVNGQRLQPDHHLLPSVTNLGHRIPVRTYDILLDTTLNIGTNMVGLWLAPGWTIFRGGNPVVNFNITRSPVVLAELRIQTLSTNNQTTVLFSLPTDNLWNCSPSVTSHIGQWTNSNFGGDKVDYTNPAVPSSLYFNSVWASVSGANIGTWSAADTVTDYDNNRIIVPEVLEPTTVIGTVSVSTVEPCTGTISVATPGVSTTGCYNITMSELFTGWLNISSLVTDGPATITLSFSTNVNTVLEYNQQDIVIVDQSNRPYCGRFSYHEMQYITITNLSTTTAPDPSSILGLRLMSGRLRSGNFVSDSDYYNRIYANSLRTYEGLTTGGMTVDCPHRERLGYGGDGHTSLEFALATYDSGAFFTKVGNDWSDVQGWDGTTDLPHTAPTIDGGGGPGWGGFILHMPWHVYLSTGDIRQLQNVWPHGTGFLDFLLSQVSSGTNLMEPFGGSWGFLGDWVTPHGNENSGTPESILFNNCYLVTCLRIAVNIANLLNDTAHSTQYTNAINSLSTAIHTTFYNSTTQSYLDTRQTHQVLPLISGIVPSNLRSGVMNSLINEIVVEQNGHLDTGLHGTYFLYKLLTDPEIGRDDILALITNQVTYPGYGNLINSGFTTWPETWLSSTPSRMHGCLNSVGLWFNQGILGVRASMDQPGFTECSIYPAYGISNLSSVTGSTLTPYGIINSSWTVSNNYQSFTYAMQIPVGITVTEFFIPGNDSSNVYESGLPAVNSPGVEFLGVSNGTMSNNNLPMTVWKITSGSYNFSSTV